MKQFVSCHTHPASLDSASTPEAMAKREVELGSGHFTVTDHGTLAAAPQVYSIAKKHSLQPIIGLEAYFRDDHCPILGKLGVPRGHTVPKGLDPKIWKETHPDGTYYDYLKYMHLTMHFENHDAYLCAVRLLSKADSRAERHGSELKPLFSWDDIEELASHKVLTTSSCLVGIIQRHLFVHKNTDAAKAYFDRMKYLFGDRFYVEVFPHVCSHNWVKAVFVEVQTPEGDKETLRFYYEKKLRTSAGEPDGITAETLANSFNPGTHKKLVEIRNFRAWKPFDKDYTILGVEKKEGFFQNECSASAPGGDVQWGTNAYVIGLAKKHDVKILIADDSHFATPDEKVIQDVRLAQGGGGWRFANSYHRQSSEEAWGHFRDYAGISQSTFESWIDNTHDWASRFSGFKMDQTPSLPTKFFPQDSLKYTKELVKKHGRMPNDPVYFARLKSELDILHRNGSIDLLPYFHIDEEICRIYENQGWLTGPGRGSAAGLLLCYLLGITHIDPIKYELSQDRFITLDRIKSGKLPDIDQDLSFREPLVGWQTETIEFEASDGTRQVVPKDFKIETSTGLMTAEEALEAGAEFEPWWQQKSELTSRQTSDILNK
jgi:DNA polymerase III alpha subunit